MHGEEFQEIAHCGGQFTFHVVTNEQGHRQYQVKWQSQRPVPATIFAVYALPQGIVVADIHLGGIGQPWNAPPSPDCYPVFIGSDSEGLFGHECSRCKVYWRSRGGAQICPNCGRHGRHHQFLTTAQRLYAQQYCELLNAALAAEEVGDHTIDMDAVAAAVGKDAKKPPFYYAEERQQNRFTCTACGGYNDILGTYGYCCDCGTRNDFAHFEAKIVQDLRAQANSGGYEACVKDTVSAFDSFAAQYARQLVARVPMNARRRARFERTFHKLGAVAEDFKAAFDIDLLAAIAQDDVAFAERMFHRRHVYEHNGGEADEKYIRDSGDTSVRPKQALRETKESAHRLISLVAKMVANLHHGFHEIFPPDQKPIELHASRKKRAHGAD